MLGSHQEKGMGWSLLIIISLFFGCSKGDEDIGVHLNSNNNFETFFTDTVTVLTSTVLLDSIPTSGANYMLGGRFVDNRLGNITGKSFFQIQTEESANTISDEAIFDSLVVMLDYSYSYGDTTQRQQFSLHKLSKKMDVSKTYYSSETVPYEAIPLSTIHFSARPGRRRPLRIRLPDALGKQLFKDIVNENTTIRNGVVEYFTGVALIPGEADNAAILGFNADSDSTGVKLYYHQRIEQILEKSVYSFSLTTTRFNYLRSDRSGTLLSSLQHTYQAVGSNKTNEEVFVQQGLGLYTRLDFPYLRNFNDLGYFALNSAKLTLRPVTQTTLNNTPPPTSLSLYQLDSRNRIGSLLSTTFTDVAATAYYTKDNINNLKYYQFGLNSYIADLIRLNIRSASGLLVTGNTAEKQLTVDRLIMGGSQNKKEPVKLEITYTLLKR